MAVSNRSACTSIRISMVRSTYRFHGQTNLQLAESLGDGDEKHHFDNVEQSTVVGDVSAAEPQQTKNSECFLYRDVRSTNWNRVGSIHCSSRQIGTSNCSCSTLGLIARKRASLAILLRIGIAAVVFHCQAIKTQRFDNVPHTAYTWNLINFLQCQLIGFDLYGHFVRFQMQCALIFNLQFTIVSRQSKDYRISPICRPQVRCRFFLCALKRMKFIKFN